MCGILIETSEIYLPSGGNNVKMLRNFKKFSYEESSVHKSKPMCYVEIESLVHEK